MIGLGLSIGLAQKTAAGSPPASTLDSLNALLAGNSSVVDLTQATGSPIGCADLSPLANDWLRATGSDPTVSGTLGIVIAAASNQNIGFPAAGGTYTLITSMTMASSDISARAISNNAGGEVLRLIQSNATLNPYPVEVDGVTLDPNTRGVAWSAIAINAEVILVITGISQTALTHLELGRGGGDSADSSFRRAVVIDEGSVTGQNLIDARALAKTWVAE